jgi:hypothetical protein
MNITERDAIIAGREVGDRLVRGFHDRFMTGAKRTSDNPFGSVRSSWAIAEQEVNQRLSNAYIEFSDRFVGPPPDLRDHRFLALTKNREISSERLKTFRKTAEDIINEYKRSLEPMANQMLQAEERDAMVQAQIEQAQAQAQLQAAEERIRAECQGHREQLQAEYQGRVEQLQAHCQARGTQLRTEWEEYRGGLARQAEEIINARRRQEQEQARQAQEERARQEQARQEQARQEQAHQAEQERARQEYERQAQERARQEEEDYARAREEADRDYLRLQTETELPGDDDAIRTVLDELALTRQRQAENQRNLDAINRTRVEEGLQPETKESHVDVIRDLKDRLVTLRRPDQIRARASREGDKQRAIAELTRRGFATQRDARKEVARMRQIYGDVSNDEATAFKNLYDAAFNFSMGRKTGRRGMSPKKSPHKTRKSPKKSPHKTRKSPKKSPHKTRKSPKKSPRKTRKSPKKSPRKTRKSR